MSGSSPPTGSRGFERILKCLLETLHIVQHTYPLRRRNKAIIALAVRNPRPD